MIIRIRSPEGQARIEVEPADDSTEIIRKISETLKIPIADIHVFADAKNTIALPIFKGRPVKLLGLTHGDILFVSRKSFESDILAEQESSTINARFVKQNEIDDQMGKLDGLIKRPRSNFCSHGVFGMCDYCMPLEPYDKSYLEEFKIKHRSFHGHLRKVLKENKTAPTSSDKFIPPLSEIDFKVKTPCPSKSHGPYPESLCTKCQPSAAVLQTQSFRMVDHLEFESPLMVENFISFWRSCGYQRFGILYGRYEPYLEVPLGIKAVVSAIYEPPQSSTADYIQLDVDEHKQNVDCVAKMLRLEQVGVIFTDLVDDGTAKGTVICKRHDESYFLSSAECIFSAKMQEKTRIPCKYSASGTFGSRMVTCVVSGNEEGNIDLSSYQVSNAAMAMVKDGIIEASIEPSLMRVKVSNEKQYIPEVFYKYKNKYGLMVQEAASPTFPVEYLLVTSSHGFPSQPTPIFISPSFPIENRGGLQVQSMGAMKKTLLNETQPLTTTLSDFHLLLYLSEQRILDQTAFEIVCQVAVTKDQILLDQLASNHSWQTLLLILQEISTTESMQTEFPSGSANARGEDANKPWSCQFCTFVNSSGANCEMCGLPKEGQ